MYSRDLHDHLVKFLRNFSLSMKHLIIRDDDKLLTSDLLINILDGISHLEVLQKLELRLYERVTCKCSDWYNLAVIKKVIDIRVYGILLKHDYSTSGSGSCQKCIPFIDQLAYRSLNIDIVTEDTNWTRDTSLPAIHGKLQELGLAITDVDKLSNGIIVVWPMHLTRLCISVCLEMQSAIYLPSLSTLHTLQHLEILDCSFEKLTKTDLRKLHMEVDGRCLLGLTHLVIRNSVPNTIVRSLLRAPQLRNFYYENGKVSINSIIEKSWICSPHISKIVLSGCRPPLNSTLEWFATQPHLRYLTLNELSKQMSIASVITLSHNTNLLELAIDKFSIGKNHSVHLRPLIDRGCAVVYTDSRNYMDHQIFF